MLKIKSFFLKKYRILLSIIILVSFFVGCLEKDKKKYLPKGYLRVDLPEKKYTKKYFHFENSTFSIELPSYFEVSKDTIKNEVYLTNEQHNFGIILNYSKVKNNLEELTAQTDNVIKDPQLMKMSHAIFEDINPTKKWKIYEITGPVATPFLFHVTDEENHFLQGFMLVCADQNKSCNINTDSLRPIIDFFKKDIYTIVNNITWEHKQSKVFEMKNTND